MLMGGVFGATIRAENGVRANGRKEHQREHHREGRTHRRVTIVAANHTPREGDGRRDGFVPLPLTPNGRTGTVCSTLLADVTLDLANAAVVSNVNAAANKPSNFPFIKVPFVDAWRPIRLLETSL